MATAENSFYRPSRVTQPDPLHVAVKNQLIHRRETLERAVARVEDVQLGELLRQVDAALERLDSGTYGICEFCNTPVEDEQLLGDPLARFCFGHLPPEQQAALERDLELAARIQSRLLPKRDLRWQNWEVAYHYKAIGMVSGDYCDLVVGSDDSLYFVVGDVSGKGVAASMLMANLNAIFRSLIPLGLPLGDLMERANRVFTGSTLPTQFATLVCGKAMGDGVVQICNAGHVPAIVVKRDEVITVDSNALPIGMFGDQRFTTSTFEIGTGESLLLVSDGVTEAHDGNGEYGTARLAAALQSCAAKSPAKAVEACIRDMNNFIGSSPLFDDQTLMVVQRVE